MGPSSEFTPSELWRALNERPCPSRVVEFPAKGRDGRSLGSVRVKVLRMDEVNDARFAADARLRKRLHLNPSVRLEVGPGSALADVQADLVAKEVLARACLTERSVVDDERGEPVYGRLFKDGAEVEKLFTGDELTILFTRYELVQMQLSPFHGRLTESERDEWLKRLEEGAAADPLAELGWHDLAELLLSSCRKTRALRESLGSAAQGSRPKSSPSGSGSEDPTKSDGGTSSFGERPSEPTIPIEPGELFGQQALADLAKTLHRPEGA